jgi:hypothetical protein
MAAAAGVMASRMDPSKDFNANKWVVSLVNGGDKLMGHAVIVVEGELFAGERFVGYYDIKAAQTEAEGVTDALHNSIGNKQGVITQIRMFQGSQYTRNYSQTKASSWYTTRQLATTMIEDIGRKKAHLKSEVAQGRYPYTYQAAGSWSFLGWLWGNGGDNCVTWAEKELVLAHVGNGSKPKDSIAATAPAHAGGYLGVIKA